MRAPHPIAVAIGIPALYGILIMISSFVFTGAGHGSVFFAAMLLAPFSISEDLAVLGLILWLAVGILLAIRRFTACRVVAAMILILHYLGIFGVSAQTEWHYVGKAWETVPLLVFAVVTVYVVSQVFMWKLIVQK